jgi:AcrR family transcriptional regulator
VFNQKGYASASTREIAQRAGVSDALIYRYFGNKAGLFREAMVQPFVELVDEQIATPLPQTLDGADIRSLVRYRIGALYDLFRSHRALAALLFVGDVLTDSDLAEARVLDDVRAQIERLVDIGEAQNRSYDPTASRPDIATRAAVAMIAGMATFGAWFFDEERPDRDVIVAELAELSLSPYKELPQDRSAAPRKRA